MGNTLPEAAVPLIAIEGVSGTAARRAMNGDSLSVYAGRVTALIGPEGSGKSSLLRMLRGSNVEGTGRVLIAGTPLSAYDNPRMAVGMIPERLPHGSRFKVATYLRWKAFMFGARRGTLQSVLDMVGLCDDAHMRIRDLPAMGLLKLGIAIALLPSPKTLVLDDPMKGLDRAGRMWLSAFLRKQAYRGMAVLITTRPSPEVEDLVDDAVLIKDGSVLKEGSVMQLKNHAAIDEAFTAETQDSPRAEA